MFRIRAPRDARGRELAGSRFGVIVQAEEMLGLGTVLVAPTSTGALPTTFRPVIEVEEAQTRVLPEQTHALDLARLGRSAGRLAATELDALDDALSLVLGL